MAFKVKAYGVKNEAELDKFREQVGAKLYLNAKDIDEKGLKVRLLPWIYLGSPVAFIHYMEGWSETVEKGEKKNHCHRFSFGEAIPDDIEWKVGTMPGSGEPTSGAPKPAIAMLLWNHKTGGVQLARFGQKTVLSPFLGFFQKSDANYVDNIHEHDIIIKKNSDKTFTLSIAAKSDPELSDAMIGELQNTLFSYELYMQGDDPFEQDPQRNVSWEEVKLVLEGGAEKPAKAAAKKTTKATATKKEPEQAKEVAVPNWRAVETAAGKILGEQTLETLQKFKAIIDKKRAAGEQTKQETYDAICYGITHFDEPEVAEALEDEDEAV